MGVKMYDFKEYEEHTQGHLFVDMLLLLHSGLFIGNPASTVTSNVLLSREAHGLVGAAHNNFDNIGLTDSDLKRIQKCWQKRGLKRPALIGDFIPDQNEEHLKHVADAQPPSISFCLLHLPYTTPQQCLISAQCQQRADVPQPGDFSKCCCFRTKVEQSCGLKACPFQ